MNLSHRESQALFALMRDLGDALDHRTLRLRLGEHLLSLLGADHFASYVHDASSGDFGSVVQLHMSRDNLCAYDDHYRHHDPVTPRMQLRSGATRVSDVVPHRVLRETVFFKEFLSRDGLCYGMNLFVRMHGRHVGDLRIWRGSHRHDFTRRDAALLDSIGPSLAIALARAANAPSSSNACTSSVVRGTEAPPVATDGIERSGLTPREAQVAVLIAEGLSDAQIAARLGIAKSTLRTHVGSIFRKCDLERRGQVAAALVPLPVRLPPR